jgi:hypothetical protein
LRQTVPELRQGSPGVLNFADAGGGHREEALGASAALRGGIAEPVVRILRHRLRRVAALLADALRCPFL